MNCDVCFTPESGHPVNELACRLSAISGHANFSWLVGTALVCWGSVTTGHSYEEAMMGFNQYHEPTDELSQKTRTFARMITSLIEEAEAISWYEQRISVEKDAKARAIMKNAQKEEFKHFGMNLEFLLRTKPEWRKELKAILFTKGDIVEAGEKAEKLSN